MSFNRTKIIATIGPASSSKEMLKEMINSGMSLARLNFSHGSHEDVLEIIKNVRELNDELGVNVGLLADLQGPKIRLGEVKDGGVPIKSGHQLTITTKKCIGHEKKVYLSFPRGNSIKAQLILPIIKPNKRRFKRKSKYSIVKD